MQSQSTLPETENDLIPLNYGSIVTQELMSWNENFNCYQLKFKARCGKCKKINKHSLSMETYTKGLIIHDVRCCDNCFKDYNFFIII